METYEAKILSMIILGFTSIFVGLLPACFANHGRRQWPLFLSTILCFGGGVLLSTSLVHILPEMRTSTPKNLREYSELIFCVGFFSLYILDEIVHYFYGDTHQINQPHSHDSHIVVSNVRRHSTSSKHPYGSTSHSEPLIYREKQFPYNPAFATSNGKNEDTPSQLCHVGHQEPCHAVPTANIGLLVALSVHSLLEGLAVGLENDSNKVLLLLGAIASHKLVVGFCLGMELSLNAAVSFCKHFMYIFIFSIGSVGGIIIGMIVYSVPSTVQTTAMPILQVNSSCPVAIIAVFTLGEGWHNYHHCFPWDYRTSEFGSEFNFSTTVIDWLAAMNLVYDLKTAPYDMTKHRAMEKGDGSHPVFGNKAI